VRVCLVRDERGIALVVALGVLLVLGIAVAALISVTTSNQGDAVRESNRVLAGGYAEAGINDAYGLLNYKNANGMDPSAANLLGCAGALGASDPNGPSDCSSPAPRLVCVAASSCTPGAAGTASVFGYFGGTNPSSYQGTTVAASTWLIFSTGYARDSTSGKVISQTLAATVKISPLNAGAVASVWNHIFITAPLTSNSCQVDFNGNGMTVIDPLYVIGNLCFSGQNASAQETAAAPVDLQVGGKLVLSGSGAKVGTDALHPITSGVVVGGCTSSSVTAPTMPCAGGGFNYWVGKQDSFVANDAPVVTPEQAATDYASFDPGPKHACATGTSPGPLPAAVFDNNSALNLADEPNNSAGSFELTPNYSYSCTSQSGANTGQLTWDNATKRLTINGAIFLDGNLTISQSATYTGTAVIELAGTLTINGNATTVCATGPPCDYNNWQGASNNNSMLTIASLATNTTAISFTNNSQTFQGSLWTQPSSRMTFLKNGVTVQGPISVGSFDASFNNASFKALPAIKNMPVGAPVPPNTGVTIEPLIYS
jgi:Tfp pilus assembly protein PilX